MRRESPSDVVQKGNRLVLPNRLIMSDFAVVFTFQDKEDWKVTSRPTDSSMPEQRVVRLFTYFNDVQFPVFYVLCKELIKNIFIFI